MHAFSTEVTWYDAKLDECNSLVSVYYVDERLHYVKQRQQANKVGH